MKVPKIGRIGTAIAVLAVLSAAGTAIAYQVGTTDEAPAAASTPKPSATVARRAGASSAPSPTKTVAAKKAAAKTTSTRCLNSFDPACGRFYWSPTPGSNADISVSVGASSATVPAGEPVSFTANGDDPDAKIACGLIYYGEGTNIGTAVRIRRQYGRWEPPAKTHGTMTKTYTHTYENAGTYTVVASFKSGDGCAEDYNPYGSEGSAAVTITVT
jgi:plastocyanin